VNDRIGIEFLSVFDMPPVPFVLLAARLGCRHISIGLTPMGCNLEGYPSFSLRDDARLRRDIASALRDNGVSIALVEGFAIRPGTEASDFAGDLDRVRELGATRINSYCMEPDLVRAFDQLGCLAEMADALGMENTVEFVPGLSIGDLSTAIAAVEHAARPGCRLLIDTMHLIRSGSRPSDLAAVDPARIGYAQICDVPLASPGMSYGEEAMFERLVPGEGELPLAEIFAILPRDIPVGIEIPRRSLVEQGRSPFERLEPCVSATARILDSL
jgi:sugar phosphate isomerase/epimerase